MLYTTITLGDNLIFPPQICFLLLADNNERLQGIYLTGQRYFPAFDKQWVHADHRTVFQEGKMQLQAYCNHSLDVFSVPYVCVGTPFQQRVWQALATIPYGQTRTYKALAISLGKPTAIRAVAQAVARNPLLLRLPCHRIIGQQASLRGYAAGLVYQQRLLDLEQQKVS